MSTNLGELIQTLKCLTLIILIDGINIIKWFLIIQVKIQN